MINKTEFKILKFIKKKKVIKTKKYINQLHSLVNDGFICLCDPETSSDYSITYHGCYITEKGQRAYEEYKHHILNITLTVIGIVIAITAIIVPICLAI